MAAGFYFFHLDDPIGTVRAGTDKCGNNQCGFHSQERQFIREIRHRQLQETGTFYRLPENFNGLRNSDHAKKPDGDIGTNVTGGKNRQIIWNISKDNIVINEAVAVEVMAIPEGIDVKFVPRGKAALLSAVVPGLGLSKLNNGGPYWVMAIGVYGAAAGSILFYSLAGQNYTKYLDAKTVDERNRLHATVERQKTTADVLLATAGAIWLGNMIWTLASPNKTKKDYGVSFGGNYDPMGKTPVINILYKF